MNRRELLELYPSEEELYIDHLINAPWFAAKELCDNVGKISHERIVEAMKEIDDSIRLLALAKLGLENKKQ